MVDDRGRCVLRQRHPRSLNNTFRLVCFDQRGVIVLQLKAFNTSGCYFRKGQRVGHIRGNLPQMRLLREI